MPVRTAINSSHMFAVFSAAQIVAQKAKQKSAVQED